MNMTSNQLITEKEFAEVFERIKSDAFYRITSGKFYMIMIKGDEETENFKIPFIPNDAQLELLRDISYRNLILKARQFGFTTLIAIVWLDHALFVQDQRCGIIAHDRESAEVIFRDKVKFAYNNLPEFMRGMFPLQRDSATELLFSHNNSSIRVATSMRSGTIHRLHVCLSGNTKIIKKDGETTPIKDIKIGEKVMTDRGSYLPVVEVVKNKLSDIGEPILKLETHGWYEDLHLTANHDVLSREFKTGKPLWKKAGELEPGDYIAFPVREISNNLRDKCLPFDKPVRVYKNDGRKKDKGRRIKVNYDLGVLIGMYLAEGHIRLTETTFALHRGEEVEWMLNLINQYSQYFNSVRVYDHKDSLTTQVVVNGKEFAKFVSRFFGKGKDKKIPDAVWGYGRKFVDGLIIGYFKGDGCFTNPREVQVTSIRPQLINQVRMLLLSTRIGVSSIYHRKAGFYYGRNCKETWVLKLHGAANWKFRKYFNLDLPEINTGIGKIALSMEGERNPIGRKNWRRGKKHYWSRIKSIDIAEDEEFVYDLVLPKDPHNYVTVNGVVHNSEFGKICAKFPEKAKEVATGSLPAVPLNGVAIIESTAEGDEGRYYQMAVRAQALKESGKKRTKRDYRFFFFGWWMNPEYRMDASNVDISPKDDEYFDEIEAEEGIELDQEQCAWYVATRDTEYAENPELMWQEYPSTWKEAFKRSTEGRWFTQQMSSMRKQGRIKTLPIENDPCWAFWDIGNSDGTAIWVIQKIGHEYRCIHFYEAWGEPYAHAIRWLQSLNLIWDTMYLPHDADHVRQGQKVNKSPRQMCEELMSGVRWEVVPRIDDITWGIQQTRDVMHLLWIDENNCKEGIKHLDQYKKKWSAAQQRFIDTPEKADGHSEAADAIRQFGQAYANGMLNISKPNKNKRKVANWRVS